MRVDVDDSPLQKKNGIGKEGYVALLAIAGIAAHLILGYLLPDLQAYSPYPLYATLAIGGGSLCSICCANWQPLNSAQINWREFLSLRLFCWGSIWPGSLVVLMLSGGGNFGKLRREEELKNA